MSQSLIGNVIPIDIDLDIDVSGGESQSLIGNVIHFMILMYSKLLSMSQSLIGNVIVDKRKLGGKQTLCC